MTTLNNAYYSDWFVMANLIAFLTQRNFGWVACTTVTGKLYSITASWKE